MERQFQTAHDIGKWIEQNNEDKNTYNEVMDAVYWFIAVREAEIMADYNRKDIAGLLLKGVDKIDGNLRYVSDHLEMLYEQLEGEGFDIESSNHHIIHLLKEHFNV